jgi:hypothetical protein
LIGRGAADVHDGAVSTLDHRGQKRMADVDDRCDVDGQHPRVVPRIAVEKWPLGGEPGIVDDEVDIAFDELTQLAAGIFHG